MTGLRLAIAGLLFRRSTAVIVLVLATVASAAAVIAPLYSRAAEESILRDTLRNEDAYTLAVQVSVPQAGGGAALGEARDGRVMAATTRKLLAHPAFGQPRLAVTGGGLYAPAAGPFRGGDIAGQVVEREGVCQQLRLAAGRCPTAVDEALVTRRSLALIGGRLGGTVQFAFASDATLANAGPAPVRTLRIVGTFDPVPVSSPYWAGRPYFSSYYPEASARGLTEVPPTADPIFVGPGTAAAAAVTRYTIDVPLLPDRVLLGDVATLRSQLDKLFSAATARQLTPDSQLAAALARADDGRELVRVAAPLAVAQLVLLSWWALYLVVGSATEERSPELGLAKLRGLSGRQTARFGLAEVLLLLVIAAPAGTLLGYAAVRAAAARVFAPGTQVVLAWPVLLTVAGALAGGLVTAVLSSRQVFRRPVADLLRRVPPRSAGRRAGVVEGVVVVLALIGVVQLSSERGGPPSPVALLAPGMVAVAGGLLAARVLVRVARRRTTSSLEQGRAAAAAGWAGIARRPGTARIASVLAVATCLLLVGVESWTVAQRNRVERSTAETGAEVVLHVRAPSPRTLLETVRKADPTAGYAMAAVQVDATNQEPSLLAVDSRAADRVIQWGSPGVRPDSSVAGTLHPPLPAPLVLRPGRLSVTIDVQEARSPSPLRLTARIGQAGSSTRIPLGPLRTGTAEYAGSVPATCGVDECRLLALAVDHPGTDISAAAAKLLLRSIALLPAGGGARVGLADDFEVVGAWRAGTPSVGGPEVRLQQDAAGLRVEVRAPGGPYAEVVRGDSPEPLPALAATRAVPSVEKASVGATTGLDGGVRYRADAEARFVPRLGERAVLVDLDLALRLADDEAAQGDPQVWLSRDDAAAEGALRERLEKAGMPVMRREARADLERSYAGNGAVLALRLLLVSGAAAVVVAVGALLVAAYIGRRQRAYEVAALRVVGLRARTVRALLLRESVGTVLVALGCGVVAAAIAAAVVLPALPQFDEAPEYAAVRYAPDLPAAAAAVLALALVLLAVGLAVAALQLRSGRPDRLREGVR